MSGPVLEALRPRGFLINIARGSLVDEAALARALQERTVAGAGLDVFVDEPGVPEVLLALDNAVLPPHVGSGTHEKRQAMADLVIADLGSFFERGEVRSGLPLAAEARTTCAGTRATSAERVDLRKRAAGAGR